MIGASWTLGRHTLAVEARRGRGYLARVGLAGLCVWFLILMQGRLSTHSAPGISLLQLQAWASYFVITLVNLVTFAGAITEEREQRTFGLLQLAGFGPFSLLLGKSIRAFTTGLLLLAVQLPFSVLCVGLGGVDVSMVLDVYVLLLAQLCMTASLGLLCSVALPTTWASVGMAHALLAFAYAAPPIAAGILRAQNVRGLSLDLADWLCQMATFRDLDSILSGTAAWVGLSVVASFLGSVLLFLWAYFLLRVRLVREEETGRDRVGRGLFARRAGSSRRVFGHPLSWKDYHFAHGGLRTSLWTLGVLLVLIAVTSFRTRGTLEDLGNLAQMWSLPFFAFFLLRVFSRGFQSEILERTLPLLGTLPYSNREIVLRKLLGGLPQVLPPLLVLWIGSILSNGPLSVFRWLASLFTEGEGWLSILLVSFTCLLTLYLSFVVRRGARALAVLIVFAGLFFCLMLWRGGVGLILIFGLVGTVGTPFLIGEVMTRKIGE